MRRFFVCMFCLQLVFLLLVLCLAVCGVVGTVASSLHLRFVETAARTDMVLSAISGLLVVAIFAFTAYVACRRRQQTEG